MQQPSETNIYDQALNYATSTLKKLSDYTSTTTNNNTMSNNIDEYIAEVKRINDEAIEDLKLKLNKLTSMMKPCYVIYMMSTTINSVRHVTIKLSTPFQRHNRTPQKPTSSPIRSTNTPLKQFGAIKTEHATTPIQIFFIII